MNFHSFRNALGGTFLALSGVFLLNSCGGGGAASTTQGNVMRIFPETATIYAGVPATFTIVGGRSPYTLSSSEPGVIQVPQSLSGNTFTVIPTNPGVVDTGIPPGGLPVKTVTIFARETTGLFGQSVVKVGQNFLTGYGLSLTPSNCPAGAPGTAGAACAGGTTAIQLQAVFNGNLYGDQQFRLEVVRGNFSLRHPVTGQVSNAITVTSDHTGTVLGLIEVPRDVATQVAVIRVIHIPTGVYADQVFVINGIPIPGQEPLTAIPSTFTFTGALTTDCGTGFGDFLVFGGRPPFTAISTNPSILVTPSQSDTNPGRFTVASSNPTICVTGATVIVTDSIGQRVTVTVDTKPGTGTPPAPVPITISPSSLTLTACGTSGSISVVGGSGPLSVNSSHPRVTAVLSGNTITITRIGAGDGATFYPTSATISVTDGSSITPATVTVPANCP